MRDKPVHISPSAYRLWKSDHSAWYRKYFTPEAEDTSRWGNSLSRGSWFDYLVKTELFNRGVLLRLDTARPDGDIPEDILSWYNNYDIASLIRLINGMPASSETELDVCIDGIPIYGFPDIYWMTDTGALCILDLKSSTTKKGGDLASPKATCFTTKDGIRVNSDGLPDQFWRSQCAIYAMGILGTTVPNTRVYGIIDLVTPKGSFRYAERYTSGYLATLRDDLITMWNEIQSTEVQRLNLGRIFRGGTN